MFKRTAGKNKKASPLDFFRADVEYASIPEINRRYDLCKQCPNFTVTKQCIKCGCFMPLKTKLLHATCPEELW